MEWTVWLYEDIRGDCPVGEFVRGQGDNKLKARLIRKMEHVSSLLRYQEPHQLGRPNFDTVAGPVKEYRVDRQVRLLLSFESEERVVLMLEAVRKKNGEIDRGAVARAGANRADWLERHKGLPLETFKEELGQ